MALIVQKYGGTSVGDVDRIKNVAQRIRKSQAEGHGLIVVVSARSGVTNELIARARSINDRPDTREMDMLLAIGEQETIALTAMALHAIGVPAVSYTGAQAGILTDQVFTKAKIKQIVPKGIMQDLKAGKVVIVAGFQGINEAGQITTLGRGGSDLTAIALAAAALFTALGDKGINIQLIGTSEIKITLAVDRAKADEAVRAAHEAFGLSK